MADPIPTATRGALRTRSGGRCEVCGRPGRLEASHRVAKGAGGSPGLDRWGLPHHALSKLIHACPADHRTIEARPRLAYAMGWKVKHGIDPRAVPAWVHGGWHLLDDDGRLSACDPPRPDLREGPWSAGARSGPA